MPPAPLRPCKKAGCKGLTATRYCSEHDTPANTYQYDQHRGSASSRGYDADWNRLRLQALSRDFYLCVHCNANGEIKSATDVDHIRPFSGKEDPLRLDIDNLQSLCKACHSRKTVLQDGGLGHSRTTQSHR